ncbi:alpha/beta fold hydrolase [Algoriphagus sp.]|uniref:S9 family peptidase n=1 Tax=Algoriphagus sp. TaxID=1872435 RepID=UPI0025FD2185|nr:alpha/beta fold hydrolase [Algoriphagus sp.]
MKKALKFFKWFFLSIIGLVGVALIVLFIIGIPKPGTFITKNVPKIGIGNAFSMLPHLSNINFFILFGFDNSQNLLFGKPSGFYVANVENNSIESFQGALPFVAYGSSAQRLKDSNTFLYLNVKNAEEDRDLLQFNTETGERETLFVGNSSVTSFGISPDNSILLVYNEDHESSVNTLYKMSLNNDSVPQALCTFKGLVEVQGFDLNMENAYVLQSYSEKDGKLYRVNLETGEAELEFEEEGESKFYHGIQFTWYARHKRFLQTKSDSIAYYVRTGSSGLSKEFSVIWEYNKNTKSLTQISPELKGDIGHIALTADERYLVYLFMHKGYSQIHAYDRVEKKNFILYNDTENPVALMGNIPFLLHPDQNKVYFSKYSMSSKELCQVDIENSSLEIIDPDPSAPNDTDITFGEFTYPTTESSIGLMNGIHSFIYKPKQPKTEKLPVFIIFHGGPDSHDIPYNAGMEGFVAPFVDDFAVITPNYRGSTGYGMTFEKADDQQNRGKQIEDVKALVDWIKTQEDLDDQKIVLMGVSWGGFMTMASLAKYPDLFLGGISMNGATLNPGAPREAGLLVGWDEAEIGDRSDPDINATIKQVSPVTNAKSISKPLLLIQAERDARVSVESARKIVKALEAKPENKLWYIEASEAGHMSGVSNPLEGIYLFSTMKQFVDELIDN